MAAHVAPREVLFVPVLDLRRTPVALAALAAASASMAQPPSAQAQSSAHPPGRHGAQAQISDAPHASTVTPGTFREPTSLSASNVGGGSARPTAEAPTEELRGPTGPAPDEITGPIGPGDAARLIQAQMPRLRPCYEQARAMHPDLAGRVELRFTIGNNGRIVQANAVGLPQAPEIATCLIDVLRHTAFPQPETPTLQIAYPVTFVQPQLVAPQTHGRARAGRPTVGMHTAETAQRR